MCLVCQRKKTSTTTFINLHEITPIPTAILISDRSGRNRSTVPVSTEQDLSCNSAPHELTGIYPTGTTCANKGSATAVYSASYDPWGNETSRVYQSVTETLSYDVFNHLVEESGSNSTQEYYVYDVSGNRVLTRSTSASTTSLTVTLSGCRS